MSTVSFVIPCYRSEKTLSGVVDEIKSTMDEIGKYGYAPYVGTFMKATLLPQSVLYVT